ncbi:MAG: FAD-binding protein [Opitutales bacterium]|nr:FAD-binding protein [Opitutales bacterium]
MENFDISTLLARLETESIEFSVSEKSRFDASLDHMRYSFMPSVVVYAKSQADIQKLLKNCNELNIPVSVRGAGTGCAGGCVPICNEIVLDVSAINFIEIDPVSRIAHVGAGAITADIDAQAKKFGLFYAPDPSSHKFSSIGGNIACNAGGLRALKYGTTRENLVALKAVLPSGEVITGGLPLKKYSVGLNLRDIFVGSEGTLGVISQAWLKLLPLPKTKSVSLAFFSSDSDAVVGVEKIMQAKLTPAVFEFMDCDTIACVRKRNADLPIPEGTSALIAEFDGNESETSAQAKKFFDTLDGFAVEIKIADGEEMEKLWKVRRSASQSMYELGDSKISQDIVLPHNAVVEFFDYYKKLGETMNLATPTFGHVGDGNYHIHFMYDSADSSARGRASDAMDLAIKKAVELGGAVSGEHGIGFLKSKYMSLQHSQVELDLMKSLKKVFDPNNILNRGKVFESYDTKNLAPLKNIKLPWD